MLAYVVTAVVENWLPACRSPMLSGLLADTNSTVVDSKLLGVSETYTAPSPTKSAVTRTIANQPRLSMRR